MTANRISRRLMLSSAGVSLLALVSGCATTSAFSTFAPDTSNGPVLVFDDAVATPKGREGFVDDLTGEKLKFFDLIFFVNKSAYGAYSQTLKILKPDTPGVENTAWRVIRTMDVSTGREMEERYFTTTPRGIFTLDPDRRYVDYQSRQWDGAEMPFTMFWDYIYPNGRPTGIAFHAATGINEHFLGIRASGGCIRTSMDESEELFDLVAQHRGAIPDFQERDPRGLLQYTSSGEVKMKHAFKVLVIVEDNEHIDWQPFVRDAIWERREARNQTLKDNPSYFELVQAGQN